jgi:F0F1-type ATP synthase membrane subunit a
VFNKQSLKFFYLLVPSGCPLGLLPLLVLIEFISYLAIYISRGLRLTVKIISRYMLILIYLSFYWLFNLSPKPYGFVSLPLQSEMLTLLTLAMVATVVVANVTTAGVYNNSDPFGFVGVFELWEFVQG